MKTTISVILLLLISLAAAKGQETVFALLKKDLKLADTYFEKKDYQSALTLYRNIAKKKSSKEIELKIARSHHLLKENSQAVSFYEKHARNHSLPVNDLYYYAEAQSGISKYADAVESYQDYLSRVPDDEIIMKKIWRLNNIEFLYEDSMHYAVRPVKFNTSYSDLCAAPFRNGVVFVSNRKEVQPIENLDGSLHAPFYKVYFSKIRPDSANREILHYETPSIFNREFNSRFHAGPFAFYEATRKMVFTSTADKTGEDGKRTLQLYFAENINGHWQIMYSFPFNSNSYSVSDPSITEDGKVLYFSSDMKGGFGGKDIYKSEMVGNHWSKPKNLGENINTAYDEVYPFYHGHSLYFSSNGHPGLGGLDIFKADEGGKGLMEAQNVGYPLNTNYDDFGIVVNALNTGGYFSSNRKHGGFNDDIYEFDMDLQTYPLEIKGVMKFKEHSLNDSLDLKIMPNARVYLIDNTRNTTVQESTCDANGNFSIVVPYYSQYKIKVVGEDNDENIVSLEIPKHKKEDGRHEIVVVKDAFKSN